MYIALMFGGWRLFICICIQVGLCSSLFGQQYLVLDRYGKNRIRIPLGSEVTFKLKGDRNKHRTLLVGLADSVVIMGDRDIYLRLEDFEAFFFERSHWKVLRYGTLIPATGFLIGAAVYPLVDDPFYDQSDSAIIGLGFVALGQSFRLLEWKKFKINKSSRVWVGGWK
jgi:hypothetical protein